MLYFTFSALSLDVKFRAIASVSKELYDEGHCLVNRNDCRSSVIKLRSTKQKLPITKANNMMELIEMVLIEHIGSDQTVLLLTSSVGAAKGTKSCLYINSCEIFDRPFYVL